VPDLLVARNPVGNEAPQRIEVDFLTGFAHHKRFWHFTTLGVSYTGNSAIRYVGCSSKTDSSSAGAILKLLYLIISFLRSTI
jgi:hypothetical protein